MRKVYFCQGVFWATLAAVYCRSARSMKKQGLRFYAIFLFFALGAKAWEDTAYDEHDFLGVKGKRWLNINNYFNFQRVG